MAKVLAYNYRSRKSKSRILNEINVTPFVDVMLVLLIIFMVTSPLLVSGVNVDLPENSLNALNADKEPLSITVDSQGKIYIQNTPIEYAQLVDKLKAITSEKHDSRIFIRGDKRVDYGKIMEVVSQINAAGYEKVTLISEIK
jgi:biopolymer transport protein TolR